MSNHSLSSNFVLYDLKVPKNAHYKFNKKIKKITRPKNNSNLHTITALESKKTIGPNHTNSLCSKSTTSQKLETASSEKKETESSLEHIAKDKLNSIKKRINSIKNAIQSIKKKI